MGREKIVLLGGNGMLGREFAAFASGAFDITALDLPSFDITRESDIERAVSAADVIVNCAAYTAVDKAESEPEICRKVNALGPAALGATAKKQNKYVLHISTDFVFGDTSGEPLSEESAANPLGVYGRTKLEGEKLLLESGCRHAVMRVEWTYGRHGANFITKILAAARKNDSLKVVDDQVGSPTHTVDVSRAMRCLTNQKAEGLFHFAAAGRASRCDVAKFILDVKGIFGKPVLPCMTYDTAAPARRPLNSVFDCSKIDKILDFKRPLWKDALERFLKAECP
jgi:dTDP-4-dehydrorhamnose reductase